MIHKPLAPKNKQSQPSVIKPHLSAFQSS